MTVRELIETLEKIDERYKDNEVYHVCYIQDSDQDWDFKVDGVEVGSVVRIVGQSD